jgi:transcriptional regulator with XRE-family HTH domain
MFHEMNEREKQVDRVLKRFQDLIAYPREDLDKELKGWIDLSQGDAQANVAQAILALANHGGGYILIGFIKSNGDWVPDKNRPSNLKSFTQDAVNGIVQSYADPQFHCEVHHVAHPQDGQIFPIIVVPGNHKVPIRAKRDGPDRKHVHMNTYYIRRPGPKSEAPQSADEWNSLINRCVKTAREDLLDNIREILFGISTPTRILTPEEEERQKLDKWISESKSRWQSLMSEKLPSEKPSRYSYGVWIAAYSISGDRESPDSGDLLKVLKKIEGTETGWPPWWIPTRAEITPYAYEGLIECWLKDNITGDAAHSDFWRASREGMMFLLRGYQEDSIPNELKPGTVLDLTIPVWRTGECLLHAERLAKTLAKGPASIRFRMTWTGLAGRVLKSWANRSRSLFSERTSQQDSVTSEVVVGADRISATLPEIVSSLTRPLYEAFDFFKPSMEMVQEELSAMRGRVV